MHTFFNSFVFNCMCSSNCAILNYLPAASNMYTIYLYGLTSTQSHGNNVVYIHRIMEVKFHIFFFKLLLFLM
jgi:hypothetical protein